MSKLKEITLNSYLAKIEDHSHLEILFDSNKDDQYFTLWIQSDLNISIKLHLDITELPHLINNLSLFKNKLEEQGITF